MHNSWSPVNLTVQGAAHWELCASGLQYLQYEVFSNKAQLVSWQAALATRAQLALVLRMQRVHEQKTIKNIFLQRYTQAADQHEMQAGEELSMKNSLCCRKYSLSSVWIFSWNVLLQEREKQLFQVWKLFSPMWNSYQQRDFSGFLKIRNKLCFTFLLYHVNKHISELQSKKYIFLTFQYVNVLRL